MQSEALISHRAISLLREQYIPGLLSIFKPPPKITISQWADANRVLSTEYSKGGHWDTSFAEYQREIMDVITDPLIDEVTVMKSARSGGTQAAINNPIGFFIDQDPGPILVIEPNVEDGKVWSKDHFDTMVRDCHCLRGKVSTELVKDKKNTILHKSFTGGILYIIGSNSPAGFRQKTIQRVFLDDVDGYELTAGEEGDQLALAKKRTLTYLYHHRKIIKVSTPTSRDLSRIEKEFKKSDMRFYFAQCPECKHHQFLRFSPESQFAYLGTSMLYFDKDNLSWVYYECENCKAKLEEKHKLQMIRNGKWVRTVEAPHHAGFHISEMISPFSSWYEVARSFLDAKHGGREALRVFVNQTLGETFVEDKQFDLNDDDLRKRVEEYTLVPAGVLVMTMQVDVQGDRLEAEVQGWGLNFENWHIDRFQIIGSPERRETWDKLDEYMAKDWKRSDGIQAGLWTDHGINCVCVDSSDNTENVYRYVKRWNGRRVYAIKGVAGGQKKKKSAKEFILEEKYEGKLHAMYASLDVDEIKRRLIDRLVNRIEEIDGKPRIPYGYYHFNQQCGQDFFEQLLSEKRALVRDKKTGAVRWRWVKKRDRNEMWDLYVYGIAAVTLLNPDFQILADKLKEKLQRTGQTQGSEPTAPKENQQQKRSKPLQPPKSNWVKNFR